jgi:class 3 adenylate cyclase
MMRAARLLGGAAKPCDIAWTAMASSAQVVRWRSHCLSVDLTALSLDRFSQGRTRRRELPSFRASAATSPRATPQVEGPSWEQKPVAVLAIEVTWPAVTASEAPRYEPWTLAIRWEQVIVEKVQGFGGVVIQRTPSLSLAVFGLPQTLEQLPQRAVQAALTLRRLVADAGAAAGREPSPAVRQAVHWGLSLVDVQARDPTARLLAIGETLALPVRLLGQTAPGEILVSAQEWEQARMSSPCSALRRSGPAPLKPWCK